MGDLSLQSHPKDFGRVRTDFESREISGQAQSLAHNGPHTYTESELSPCQTTIRTKPLSDQQQHNNRTPAAGMPTTQHPQASVSAPHSKQSSSPAVLTVTVQQTRDGGQ